MPLRRDTAVQPYALAACHFGPGSPPPGAWSPPPQDKTSQSQKPGGPLVAQCVDAPCPVHCNEKNRQPAFTLSLLGGLNGPHSALLLILTDYNQPTALILSAPLDGHLYMQLRHSCLGHRDKGTAPHWQPAQRGVLCRFPTDCLLPRHWNQNGPRMGWGGIGISRI